MTDALFTLDAVLSEAQRAALIAAYMPSQRPYQLGRLRAALGRANALMAELGRTEQKAAA